MSDGSQRQFEVFISYSSKDKAWADAACAVLEGCRIRCWIAPRDITPGMEWGEAIIKGITACKIMVLIFSDHANASGQVRREVERAVSKGLTLLPFRVEDVHPKGAMEYALGNTHWLDAFTPPVERQTELLAESVSTLLGRGRGASRVKTIRATNIPSAQPQSRLLVGLASIVALLLIAGVGYTLWKDNQWKDKRADVAVTVSPKETKQDVPSPSVRKPAPPAAKLAGGNENISPQEAKQNVLQPPIPQVPAPVIAPEVAPAIAKVKTQAEEPQPPQRRSEQQATAKTPAILEPQNPVRPQRPSEPQAAEVVPKASVPSGKNDLPPDPTPSAPAHPASKLLAGSPVTVTANVSGYEDEWTTSARLYVRKGAKGKVIAFAKNKLRCYVRLSSPVSTEVWILRDKLEPE